MAEIYKTDYIEIKKIMAEKEIKTIKELAEKTGINRNTLSNILKCSPRPTSWKSSYFLWRSRQKRPAVFFLALSYAPRKLRNGGTQ